MDKSVFLHVSSRVTVLLLCLLLAVLAEPLSAQSGKILELNGVDSYALLRQSLPDMTEMTLEVWLFHVPSGTDRGVIFMDSDSDVFNVFLANIEPDFIGIAANKSGAGLRHSFNPGMIYVAPPLDRAWHHLAWVMEPQQSTVYLDGGLVTTLSESGSNVDYHADRSVLGRSFVAGRSAFFRGYMDDFRIWTRALTAQEIQVEMTAPASGPELLIDYDFEDDGPELQDRSGNGRSAELVGGARRVGVGAATVSAYEEPGAVAVPYRRYLDIPLRVDWFDTGIALSPDNRTLAVVTRPDTTALWNLDAAMEIGSLPGQAVCTFVRNGRQLLIGTELWDVLSKAWVASMPVSLTGTLRDLVPMADARVVALACRYGSEGGVDAYLHLWDLDRTVDLGHYSVGGCNMPWGNCTLCIGTCNSPLGGIDLAISADGRWAATGRSFFGYQDMLLWEIATGEQVGAYWAGAQTESAFSAASDRFAYAMGSRLVVLGLVPELHPQARLTLDGVPSNWFFTRDDAEFLIVGGTWIDTWDLNSRTRLARAAIPSQGLETLTSHGLLRPDGRLLVVWDGPMLRFYTVPDLVFAGGIPTGLSTIDEVKFTPDGRYLIVRSGSSTIRVWQATQAITAVRDQAGDEGNRVDTLTLPPAYPNPANPGVWIPYVTGAGGPAKVSIYSISGQLVRILRPEHASAGPASLPGAAVYWDGCDEAGAAVAAGLYVYLVAVSGMAASGRLVLLK